MTSDPRLPTVFPRGQARAASDPRLLSVFARRQARASGFTDDHIDRRLRTGRWRSLRHGFMIAVEDPRVTAVRVDPQTVAVLRAHRRDLVISHAHAARAHGLPSPLGGWGPLTVTATSGPTRRRAGVRVVVAPCAADEVVVRAGVRLTSPVRTVVDCLRSLPPADGLALADAALRRGLVTVPGLRAALDRCRGWPGAPRARKVAALADTARETPLESWSAWAFWELDVPAPQWQVDILDVRGAFLGRADAWWRSGVVGEADGRAKYRLAAEERGGADAERLAAVLAAERRREAGMRRAGAAVVRWSAADVLLPHRARELADHLRREVADASTRNAFTGRALCGPGRERAPPSSALRGPERGRELRGRGRERPGRERGEAST